MDSPQTITHVSLCAGYGGIDLGLKRAIPSLRTIAFSEIEAFACANLVAKMEAGLLDAAPVWTNVKTFPWGKFHGCVDILSSGYPCQPFSQAGRRLGKEDPRHLWPHIADGIRAMRPVLCVFENVEGHITLGLSEVIGELEAGGYTATWGIFSASECGAPHHRKRVFIVAYDNCERGEELCRQIAGTTQYPPLGTSALLADRLCNGSPARIPRQEPWHEGHAGILEHGHREDAWPSYRGQEQQAWEPPRIIGEAQPPLGRDADGPAGGVDYAELCRACDNRTDELRLLGNGVVPATATRAFLVLLNRLTTHP